MPPNFQQQQQSAQRMHQQTTQTTQRINRQATETAQRMGRPVAQPMRPTTNWGPTHRARGPFRLVGFLVFLAAFLALAITFGPQLADRMSQQADLDIGTDSGTEQPTP